MMKYAHTESRASGTPARFAAGRTWLMMSSCDEEGVVSREERRGEGRRGEKGRREGRRGHLLLGREEAGHVARGEQVVHVHEEALVGDLRVGEEEGDALALEAALAVHRLQARREGVGREGAHR